MQDKFDELLKRFNLLVKDSPKADKIAEKLQAIKEEAKISKELTFAQVDAIKGRVDNYVSGRYGNTKSEENLKYGAAPVK